MKPKSGDIKKKLRQQDDDVYGDQAPGGHDQDLEADDDVEKIIEETMGTDAAEDIENDEYDFHMELENDEKQAGGITTPKLAAKLIKEDKLNKKAA